MLQMSEFLLFVNWGTIEFYIQLNLPKPKVQYSDGTRVTIPWSIILVCSNCSEFHCMTMMNAWATYQYSLLGSVYIKEK